jgi:hypothetical protein
MLGTADDLPGRFLHRYRGLAQIPRTIENEVRGHSYGDDTEPGSAARAVAATAIVGALFLGQRTIPAPELRDDDLMIVDNVVAELRAFPGGKDKKHGGEAVLIVLATRAARESGRRQVLLSNDGGASVVADHNGVPTRHAADVLAEFACADPELPAQRCLKLFRESCAVSAPPKSCRPRTADFFECKRSGGGCEECDEKNSNADV